MPQSQACQTSGCPDNNLVLCELCSQPRFFKGQRGLKIHKTRIHSFQNSFDTTSLPLPTDSSPPSASLPTLPLWQKLSLLKNSRPLLKRIPRGARVSVAQALGEVIKKVNSFNNADSWENLFTFAYQTLYIDHGERGCGSLTQKVKNNCSQPSLIDFSALPRTRPRKTNPQNYKIVENKVSDGDLKGAAQLLFSNDVVAPDNPVTLSALHSKHPLPASTLRLPDPPLPTVQPPHVTPLDIRAALISFKKGTAGGLDGLSPQHLIDLTSEELGNVGSALLVHLTSLINLMLSGNVNESIIDILYGANLIALKKRDGGIRPIAIGSTIRRLASKIAVKSLIPDIPSSFQPIQLGFGTRGGCEAAVHSVRTFLHNNGGEVLLKVDVKNAFNSVDRGALLTQVKLKCGHLFNYIWQCYSKPTKLIYKNHLLSSSVGCQQGDPLGPALFSLAIHPIISELNSKLNIWYLDDGTIGGSVISVLEDLKKLTREFEAIGLVLNFSKCELYISDSLANKHEIISKFSKVAPDISVLDKQTLHLLGAPIFDESIPNYISEKVSKFEQTSEGLLKINPHMALSIIRCCTFVPKFTYVMRCSHLWKFENLLNSLDNILKEKLCEILNCPLDDTSWCQASLPIRFGGLGIRKTSSVALPAFLASSYSIVNLSRSIINPSLGDVEVACLAEARSAWVNACPDSTPPIHENSQRQWDEPLCKRTFAALLEASSGAAEQARLLAVAERESGFWLHALPSANVGTVLDSVSLSIAVSLRLGLRLNHAHTCRCGEFVGPLGHHGLSCAQSAGRIPRHASLNDILRRAFISCRIPAVLEPPGICRSDGKRPDGMTLIPWNKGKSLVWDATCVDTLAPSHVSSSSRGAGAAAASAEARKRSKYSTLDSCYRFAPFAVETLGPWGPEARKLYGELSARLVQVSGDRNAGSYLGQRLSLAIQRGNAASILGTVDHGVDISSL